MCMKTALIAISTNGKREDILEVINNVKTSLKKINVKPVFSICADETDIILNKPLEDTIYFSLKPEKFDYTRHNIEAIERGISHFNPNLISIIADDFVMPAKKFSSLIKPLLNGYDATFSCWGSNKIASTYPKFQYVSELFLNRITNVAPKTSIPDYEKMLSYSFDYKSDFSCTTQIFCGIFAFHKECWTKTLARMVKIFGTTKLEWSLEVASLLSAKALGLKIINVECDKIKEKNSPVLGEMPTRIVQIKDAFECVNTFLKYTKQHDKLQKMSKIQSEMIKVIEDIMIESGI